MTHPSQTDLSGPSACEVAFSRAIDAGPDDDTIRLIFADWLDERGDPRADAIRKRCEQIKRIKEKFPLLKSADVRFSYRGARSHRYELQPPLPAATLRALESQYGVRFPDDYFDFVVRFAEAGAGPSYLIQPVRKVCYDGMAKPFPFAGTADPNEVYEFPGKVTGCILLVAMYGCGWDTYCPIYAKYWGWRS
jgi:uncharacterized protein (TIGR02996 family)